MVLVQVDVELYNIVYSIICVGGLSGAGVGVGGGVGVRTWGKTTTKTFH